ncbi:hypothetical protein LIER_25965 [Lithospermum erythrorhizon]|uniref:Gag-pol polyprotein n=1 Tax=Lithospermum erythrorhizon TaxID=34254 RepID=A0AAV3R9S5_LITER
MWSIRNWVTIACVLDMRTWKAVLTGWTVPTQNNDELVVVVKEEANWTNDEAELSLGNNKALNAIFCVVDTEVFKLISSCTVAKKNMENFADNLRGDSEGENVQT